MKSILSLLLFFLFLPIFPDSIPDDFTLDFKDGGGMRPRSETLFLSIKECKYTIFDIIKGESINKESKFKMKKADLEKLYNLLVKNQYDKITYEDKGHVNDRGGKRVTITADGKTVTINDYYSYFVDKDWYTNWTAITMEINAITEKERKKLIKSKTD